MFLPVTTSFPRDNNTTAMRRSRRTDVLFVIGTRDREISITVSRDISTASIFHYSLRRFRRAETFLYIIIIIIIIIAVIVVVDTAESFTYDGRDESNFFTGRQSRDYVRASTCNRSLARSLSNVIYRKKGRHAVTHTRRDRWLTYARTYRANHSDVSLRSEKDNRMVNRLSISGQGGFWCARPRYIGCN